MRAGILAAMIAATPAAAEAQSRQCGPRDSVVATLTGRFGEARIGAGIAGTTAIAEIYVSADTGTWTMTVTMPDGVTCLIAAGTDWQAAPGRLPPNG